MSRVELDDIIEQWTEVPILAKVVMSLDIETDKVKMFPYELRRLRGDVADRL